MAGCALRQPLPLLLLPGRSLICCARLRSTAAAPKQKEEAAADNAEARARGQAQRRLRDVPRPPPAPARMPDFSNSREAYRSKTSAQLLRSLLVFRLCSYDLLVDRHKEVGG